MKEFIEDLFRNWGTSLMLLVVISVCISMGVHFFNGGALQIGGRASNLDPNEWLLVAR